MEQENGLSLPPTSKDTLLQAFASRKDLPGLLTHQPRILPEQLACLQPHQNNSACKGWEKKRFKLLGLVIFSNVGELINADVSVKKIANKASIMKLLH